MLTPEELDIPLSALLAKAEAAVSAAKAARPVAASRDEDGPDQYQHALDLVRAAEAAADAAGVLPSPGSGETAEDVPASDLRFALLPAWAGDLLAARAAAAGVVVTDNGGGRGGGGPGRGPPRPAVDPSIRAAALTAAAAEHRRFLAGLRLLGVLPPEARHGLMGGGGGVGSDGDEGSAPARPDPAATRAAKVAAFKARKTLAAKAADLAVARHDGGDGGDEGGDPAAAHAAAVVELQVAALDAADAVCGAGAELALLRAAAALSPAERAAVATCRAAGGADGAGPPPDIVAALRAAADGLAGRGRGRAAADLRPNYAPASLGGPSSSALGASAAPILSAVASAHADRAQLAAEVFRPSHLPPTKTLAALAAEEVAAARQRSASEARAEAARAAAREAAGSDDDGLEADGGPGLDAARRMDDWKDDHPRGYGNSKLRPAAL